MSESSSYPSVSGNDYHAYEFSLTRIARSSRESEVISHRFFQSPVVNVGAVAIHSCVECIFSLSNILNFALSALYYVGDVPGLILSCVLILKVLRASLTGKCVNGSHVTRRFTTGLAILTLTPIR